MHHRRSIRLPEYDYAAPGTYFVTLISWNRENIFGEIFAGEMRLNAYGVLIQNEWQRLAARFSRVRIDAFVVMPNHLHGIVLITADGDVKAGGVRAGGVGARQNKEFPSGDSSLASPLPGQNPPLPGRTSPRLVGPSSGSLGSIVGAFKSTTARLINGLRHTPGISIWQRNYYEHIIRSDDEWQRINAYIQVNPDRWKMDQDNPEKDW